MAMIWAPIFHVVNLIEKIIFYCCLFHWHAKLVYHLIELLRDMNNRENTITILVEQNADLAEIDVPIEYLRKEIAKFITAMIPYDLTLSLEVEFEIAVNPTGKLLLLGYTSKESKFKGISYKVRLCKENSFKTISASSTSQEKSKRNPRSLAKTFGNKYSLPATFKTPALMIFLLDVSGSMSQELINGLSRIDAATQIVQKIAQKMVMRSTKGTLVVDRYHIAMFAYSGQTIDLLGGIKSITELAKLGVPRLTVLDMTDTAGAFSVVRDFLISELPTYVKCPAPLVIHITDGEFNGGDPMLVAEEICTMNVEDGNVLLANIYLKGVSSEYSAFFTSDKPEWLDTYEEQLFHMSSLFPEQYRAIFKEFGYDIHPGAKMYFRGWFPEIYGLLIPMSGTTPVTRS